jgi:hypothetical protein
MAANITIANPAIGTDGVTLTADLLTGGVPGSGYAISNANGISVNSGGVRHMVTGVSVSGTVLTLTLGFPTGSGFASNNISLTTGTSITDGSGNTSQAQTGLSVTNNSTVTVTKFDLTNSSFKLFGTFAESGGPTSIYYAGNPSTSGAIFGITGATQVALITNADAVKMSLDGAADSSLSSNLLAGAVGVYSIASSLGNTAHEIAFKTASLWFTGLGTSPATIGTIWCVGSGPTLSAPAGSWGTRYLFSSTPFTTYGDFNAEIAASQTKGNGAVYKQLQPGGSIRFTSDSTFIAMFTQRYLVEHKFAVYQDGVLLGDTTMATDGSGNYYRTVLATGLSGTHEYEIRCIHPTIYDSVGWWYEGYVELNGSGIMPTAHPARSYHWTIGDSIVAGYDDNGVIQSLKDNRVQDYQLAALAAGRQAGAYGVGGQKWTDVYTFIANVTPASASVVHLRHGTNDLSSLGTAGPNATFQNAVRDGINNVLAKIGSGKRIYVYQPLPRVSGGANRGLAGTLMVAAIAACNTPSEVTYVQTDSWWTPVASTNADSTGLHPWQAGFVTLSNRFVKIFGATAISITGPSAGTAGVASGNGTVTLANAATFTGDETVTITSSNGSDIITPSVGSPGTGAVTVTPSNGATSFTYTVTRSTAGTSTLTPTAAQAGWTMPSAASYVATASGTGNFMAFF